MKFFIQKDTCSRGGAGSLFIFSFFPGNNETILKVTASPFLPGAANPPESLCAGSLSTLHVEMKFSELMFSSQFYNLQCQVWNNL